MSPTAVRLQRERRGTILVVAGSDLRSLLSDTLASAGYCVVTIGNSTDAVAFLRRQTVLPAMVLLDWNAPGMSGLQFIAFHASSLTCSRAPIAVISEPTANNIPRLCVQAIVHRPFDPDSIVDLTDRVTRLVTVRETGEHNVVPPLE
jgi:DNA-binding response OmpR family regulator